MAKITLYSARACPFAHRTRLVLAHKQLDFVLEEIDLQNKPEWFSSVSAYGKVPAIAHDGRHIWESAVINEYLEELFREPALLPKEPFARASARIWIDYFNTRFVSAYGALLRAPRDAEEGARRELTEALEYIEREGLAKRGEPGPFFLGSAPSLVDFALYPWFERWSALDHHRSFPVPARLVHLHAWQAAVRELEAVRSHESPASYYIERYARFVPARAGGQAPRASV